MSDIDDGGAAFPMTQSDGKGGGGYPLPSRGMSLRDWFAGQVLVGILSNPETNNGIKINGQPQTPQKASYMIADAMIAERNK